jgi:hypothetical protein
MAKDKKDADSFLRGGNVRMVTLSFGPILNTSKNTWSTSTSAWTHQLHRVCVPPAHLPRMVESEPCVVVVNLLRIRIVACMVIANLLRRRIVASIMRARWRLRIRYKPQRIAM